MNKREYVYVTKSVNKDMTSHHTDSFKYPEKGFVEVQDWDETTDCGNGLHGLLWGEGEGSLASYNNCKWLLIKVAIADGLVVLDGKCKFRKGEVIKAGTIQEVTEELKKYLPNDRHYAVIGATTTVGKHDTATAGYKGTVTAGDYGTVIVGDWGVAKAGAHGTATAGYNGIATAGYNGTAIAGSYGATTAGERGTATAEARGTATVGAHGTAVADEYGKAKAGAHGTAIAGDYGTATAGTSGIAKAGYSGTAIAGDYGTATAGVKGKAKAGIGGHIMIKASGTKKRKHFEVDGITVKSDTFYSLNENNKLEEAE